MIATRTIAECSAGVDSTVTPRKLEAALAEDNEVPRSDIIPDACSEVSDSIVMDSCTLAAETETEIEDAATPSDEATVLATPAFAVSSKSETSPDTLIVTTV